MNRTFKTIAIGTMAGILIAGHAHAQSSFNGFPINEPSAKSGGANSGTPQKKKKKDEGPLQITVDAYGPGPYKSINKAIEDIAVGGVIYIQPGVYEESISLDKTVFLRGDRGPGPGVIIEPNMNEPCLSFKPDNNVAHAVVSNVRFVSKINSSAEACVQVESGVFTLKESDVTGSGTQPAVKISGGTAMLEKNHILAGSKGVFVDQKHSLSQSFIIDNTIDGNNIGVDIAYGSYADVVIAGNEIFNNVNSGVKSSGFGGAKLIGNKIRNNKGAGVILDKYAKLSLIRHNDIIQNAGDGVAVPFGAKGIIEDNNFVGNEGLAIYVRDGLKPKTINNFMDNNYGDKKGKKRRKKKRRRN